jgi:hypothetical protein
VQTELEGCRDWWELASVWSKREADHRSLTAISSPIGGLVGDLLRSSVARRFDPPGMRMPLRERVEHVQEGGEQHLAAIVWGTLPWCPPIYNSERTLHLMGVSCWHTKGLVSEQLDVPTRDLRALRVRPPRADVDVERPAARRRTWAALELASGAGGATILAHRTDLALLGLVSDWVYPA